MALRKNTLIELEGNLSIQKVEALFADFKSKLIKNSSIQLDFSKVSGLDFAALQLLFSLNKTCLEKDIKIEFQNVNPKIMEWFELSDLTSLIT
ncbi:MAG: hypothetical protein B6241_05485 [Spirochaetaceae bacterium 4572_59]|nr:MAG: hypothetical protein B6241_05485 [Spirochaetaceae bacterium 4572_59]